MRNSVFGVCFSAMLLASQAAMAQCPNPQAAANPLSLITNRTWTFTTQAADFGPNGAGSAGRFTATGSGTSGLLTITGSFSDGNGGVTRVTSMSGRFQVSADCSGGQLSFSFSDQAIQYEFVFASNFSELYLVSTTLSGVQGSPMGDAGLTAQVPSQAAFSGATVYVGRAKGLTSTGCPAGVNPLSVLAGTSWSFQTQAIGYAGGSPQSASVGTFRATAPSTLSIVQTVNTSGSVARLASNSGRFFVNADCSGGDLLFNLGGNPSQFSFFFSDNSFSEMVMITDNTSSGFYGPQFLLGIAKRQLSF
ncbi:MAG: hypothetical protein K2X03_07030 [Bryobacteraceae bacterium]|nr:hypothetical protein [Bryobacteraceae bacterium]